MIVTIHGMDSGLSCKERVLSSLLHDPGTLRALESGGALGDDLSPVRPFSVSPVREES